MGIEKSFLQVDEQNRHHHVNGKQPRSPASVRVGGGARQEFRERLLLFSAQVVWAAQEQAAVEPQVLAYFANLVPITPGLRGWLQRRRRCHGLHRLGERGGIRQGKLRFVRLGRRVLIEPAELQRLIEQGRIGGDRNGNNVQNLGA